MYISLRPRYMRGGGSQPGVAMRKEREGRVGSRVRGIRRGQNGPAEQSEFPGNGRKGTFYPGRGKWNKRNPAMVRNPKMSLGRDQLINPDGQKSGRTAALEVVVCPVSCKWKKYVGQNLESYSTRYSPTAPRWQACPDGQFNPETVRIEWMTERGIGSHVEVADVETTRTTRKEGGWVASRQDSQHCHARSDKGGCSRQPILWLCATGCVDNQCVDSQVKEVKSDIQCAHVVESLGVRVASASAQR